MTLKLDNFGRIVAPKEIRERLGIGAGMDLEKAIELAAEALKTYKKRIPDPPPYQPAQ